MERRFYTRRFLNLPGCHGGAYILAEVEATGPDDPDWSATEPFIEITDCARRVRLDFPLYSAEERRNSLRKARILAGELTRFADALEVEAELTARRQIHRQAEALADTRAGS